MAAACSLLLPTRYVPNPMREMGTPPFLPLPPLPPPLLAAMVVVMVVVGQVLEEETLGMGSAALNPCEFKARSESSSRGPCRKRVNASRPPPCRPKDEDARTSIC